MSPRLSLSIPLLPHVPVPFLPCSFRLSGTLRCLESPNGKNLSCVKGASKYLLLLLAVVVGPFENEVLTTPLAFLLNLFYF
jgi:hypothetical protein